MYLINEVFITVLSNYYAFNVLRMSSSILNIIELYDKWFANTYEYFLLETPYIHFNEWFLETMCVKKTKMKTKGKVQFAKKLFAP